MCGFGPPYPSNYRVTRITDWVEEVADEPVLLKRGLREAGWDEDAIQEFARQNAALAREPLPRESRINRLRTLLRLRKRVVEETWTEVVEVPLYRFGAPPVRGAKVEYSEGETITDGSGWSLKFRGIGMADTTAVEVSKSRTFVATDGSWKQVYVPVKVRISRVAQFDGETCVGHGHEGQVIPPSESDDPLLQRRGIRSVDGSPRLGSDGTLDYHDLVDLALAGDSTGAIHKEKRSWVTDVSREISIRLDSVADVSALVRVKRTRRLELAFELPAGHDYRAYLCNGFTHWDAPRGPMTKKVKQTSNAGTAA